MGEHGERPIVDVQHLFKCYQQGKVAVEALRDVSLSIVPQEFAVLCGPSGSGKTTLLNLIGGLDQPTSGDVWVEGMRLAQMSQGALSQVRRDRIGFVFQAYNLIPVMSAFENAAFVLELQGVATAEIKQRVEETLLAVGLQALADRRPDEMSGGQQQRVAIARAIVARPAIVLADEPTANVDSQTAESLLQMMQGLNEKQGITFLFSSHDQRVIDCGKRVIRMRDGAIELDHVRA
ncbi:MAG: ABC transporter ATP-binding protein [Zetaproteobacteria bacterium]|nr:ABC transporter ATP-binding protein [Zetaproteobacteria bacterium]